VATLQPQAAEKHITLATDCPATAVLGAADGVKIAWVLTNLIGNAMRYTDAGGRIEVRVAQHGQQVYTSVKDDGVGIPYEFQSKIFDKFMQVKSERAVGGTGLGLSISREIVRAHRGTIWVESVPGEGSLFTFTVPSVASET
jgi:two-component system, NtrC family, sensor histidine kinase KinB